MKDLTISDQRFTLFIGSLDGAEEMEIELVERNEYCFAWINKEQAIQIINHLKEQFEL